MLKRKLPNDDPPGAYDDQSWNVEKGELIATSWGLLSALSLVMGAGLALLIKVGPRTMALMMAFGGGALVEALCRDARGRHGVAGLSLSLPASSSLPKNRSG